jgi:hypothetical protein
MNPTVHIFFNGTGVRLPERNEWEKFGEVDALRLFLVCADSWRRHGWDVRRLSTVQGDYPATHFLEEGRVQTQFHWYAEELWQFVAKAKSVAVDGPNVFCTMDVINAGVIPAAIRLLDLSLFACYSFQAEHSSLSCFVCTRDWLDWAENILLRYDRSELGLIPGDYVSDEAILRTYLPSKIVPWQKFACNPGPEKLIHFSRSSLARLYSATPLSFSHADQEKS